MIQKVILGCYIVFCLFIILFMIIVYYRRKYLESIFKDDELDLHYLFNGINGFTFEKNDKYNLTYGEITLSGIKNIKKYLIKHHIKPDIFIDLGCGAGKSVVMASKCGFKECYGIEITENRYNESIKLYNRLDKKEQEKINMIHDDLFNMDNLIEIDNNRHYTIFVSNLLFSVELNKNLWSFLKKILPNNSILVVSNQVEYNKYEDRIDTPMTWDRKGKCYIYKIKK